MRSFDEKGADAAMSEQLQLDLRPRAQRVASLTVRFTERFWRRVEKAEGGCWIWKGSIATGGYGTIRSGGKGAPWLRTHRASWILHFGPIPEGLFVCHRCDTPACVHPEHLFLGSPSDNMRDMFRKRRHRGAVAIETYFGERNGRSKLNATDVRELRRRHGEGEPTTTLACEFGVSSTTARAIIRRRIWRHVA